MDVTICGNQCDKGVGVRLLLHHLCNGDHSCIGLPCSGGVSGTGLLFRNLTEPQRGFTTRGWWELHVWRAFSSSRYFLQVQMHRRATTLCLGQFSRPDSRPTITQPSWESYVKSSWEQVSSYTLGCCNEPIGACNLRDYYLTFPRSWLHSVFDISDDRATDGVGVRWATCMSLGVPKKAFCGPQKAFNSAQCNLKHHQFRNGFF